MGDRQFVKFTFLKVPPEWRRRDPEERTRDKREFAAACEEFAEDHYLRAYSLLGTRGDADLMLRTASARLDAIHELHVLLAQSGLMAWADPYSFLAMTKPSPYSDEPSPLAVRPGSERRYLIVYPMWKKREWYLLSPEERMRIMRGHIEVGRLCLAALHGALPQGLPRPRPQGPARPARRADPADLSEPARARRRGPGSRRPSPSSSGRCRRSRRCSSRPKRTSSPSTPSRPSTGAS